MSHNTFQNETILAITLTGSRMLEEPSGFETLSAFLNQITDKMAILPSHSIAQTFEALSFFISKSIPDYRGDVEEMLARMSLRLSVGLTPIPEESSTFNDLRGSLSNMVEGETSGVDEVRGVRDDDEI